MRQASLEWLSLDNRWYITLSFLDHSALKERLRMLVKNENEQQCILHFHRRKGGGKYRLPDEESQKLMAFIATSQTLRFSTAGLNKTLTSEALVQAQKEARKKQTHFIEV